MDPNPTWVIASGHRDRDKTLTLDGGELFAIASQSKMFTAAAVLLLIKEGAIKLADPVARYVPERTGRRPACDH